VHIIVFCQSAEDSIGFGKLSARRKGPCLNLLGIKIRGINNGWWNEVE